MPPGPAGSTGGAASSLIGVITELKAMPGNCVRAAFENILLALLPALERQVILSVLNSGW